MDLHFDIRGNLTPYDVIEVSLEDFRMIFVESFDNESSRNKIFKNFEAFLGEFKEKICSLFVIWIDGSFVTNKPNPNDIDVLIFLDSDLFREKEIFLRPYKTLEYKNTQGLDLYFIIKFSENSKESSSYQFDKIYWQNQFSKTAKNRAGKSFEKRYLQIKFY